LRHEYPDRSLCLIVGMDAFLSLPKWHQWRELLQLGAFGGRAPPGVARAGHGAAWASCWSIAAPAASTICTSQRSGCIYIHAVTQLEISSTDVRQLIAMGRDPRFLMPDSVRKLILDANCYAKSRTLSAKDKKKTASNLRKKPAARTAVKPTLRRPRARPETASKKPLPTPNPLTRSLPRDARARKAVACRPSSSMRSTT
jgi:hypothetical protein